MTAVVVKIGGGVLGVPGAFEAVCAAVGALGRRERVVVVPGGGPLADAVRSLDRRLDLSADTAHWMAILAMDQYAQVLAERIDGATLVEDSGAVAGTLASGRIAVLAPSRWLRAADPLPHSWDATSDSLSVFLAVALDAGRLVLVKPADVGEAGVDPDFARVAPEGLEVSVVGWERFVAACQDTAAFRTRRDAGLGLPIPSDSSADSSSARTGRLKK
jgi:aspartokinase-like uncharacterized kinase